MLQQAIAPRTLPLQSPTRPQIPCENPSSGPPVDLRGRRRADIAELALERSLWLLPEDRALVHAVYRDSRRIREIALLRARAETLRSLHRRIRALVARMTSARFTLVLHERDAWPPLRRRVATACILQGRTMRDAATHLHLSLHRVRREMQTITTLLETRES